jgi:23S rRNA (cytosine1962-C5)-methyltransferase
MSIPLQRVSAVWKDFALLDSGDGEKMERFGDVVMIRPEPQALWRKDDASMWQKAHLEYTRHGREGDWTVKQRVPDVWTIRWEDLAFRIRPTSFKHTGLFPEQASNWAWIRSEITPGMQVLNLFGYTGAATLAAARAGASVTHVDASKPVVTWGKENAELSGLSDAPIRWIVDDVQRFVARELRRGNRYDAIFMDPPAFGRGPEGEVWQFEEHLPTLLADCTSMLRSESGRLLVNAYSLGFPALTIENLVRTTFAWPCDIAAVELTLKEVSDRGFELPTGIAIRCGW